MRSCSARRKEPWIAEVATTSNVAAGCVLDEIKMNREKHILPREKSRRKKAGITASKNLTSEIHRGQDKGRHVWKKTNPGPQEFCRRNASTHPKCIQPAAQPAAQPAT
jgi:hypothetical protein